MKQVLGALSLWTEQNPINKQENHLVPLLYCTVYKHSLLSGGVLTPSFLIVADMQARQVFYNQTLAKGYTVSPRLC